jgi:hypothetical protein
VAAAGFTGVAGWLGVSLGLFSELTCSEFTTFWSVVGVVESCIILSFALNNFIKSANDNLYACSLRVFSVKVVEATCKYALLFDIYLISYYDILVFGSFNN